MISNRASDAGTPKGRMTGAKTLAAAMILSIAGVSAAHACTGYMTIHNKTDSRLDIHNIYTQNKNGSWLYNFSWPTGIYLKANETKVRVLNTTRKASRSFAIRADTSVGNLYSDAATCSQGWTLTAE